MARTITTGIDEEIKRFTKIYTDIDKIEGKALYEGAKVVADAMKAEINALPNKSGSDPHTGLLNSQKEGLIEGLGISTKKRDGDTVLEAIGFAGYNNLVTKRWPNGQPNAMVARSLIRGTSFLIRDDFVARAISKSKAAAVEAMRTKIIDELEKIK